LLHLRVGDDELWDAPAASAARFTTAARTRKLKAQLIDWSSGNELAEQERCERYPDESRDHQQNASDDVIPEGFAARLQNFRSLTRPGDNLTLSYARVTLNFAV
jgi:hypothetical protein